MKSTINLLLTIILTMGLFSCTKYLDEKPDQKLAVPESLSDLQALMDNYSVQNNIGIVAAEASSDDYYLSYTDWSGMTDDLKRMYTWEKDYLINQDGNGNEWYNAYSGIYFANTVLENLGKITIAAGDSAKWKELKGEAYFYRGSFFFNTVSVWSLAYDEKTATTDLGIPLRLNTNFNEQSVRATVEKSYTQLLSDLKQSLFYLPLNTISLMRPNKAAAYGMLARVYLSMRKYAEAGLYADSSLQLYSKLLDFNTLNANSTYPISQFNTEVQFEGWIATSYLLYNNYAKIDSVLYGYYEANDLRKTINFKKNSNGSYSYYGSYEGNLALFGGVATDELYLIRAESAARAAKTTAAIADINTLLLKRYKTGTYSNYTETDAAKVLQKVLLERRKELLMRSLRWLDIKRLNKEGYNITQKRILNGITYELPPNDLRYALAIPEDVIALSGMQPNPR